MEPVALPARQRAQNPAERHVLKSQSFLPLLAHPGAAKHLVCHRLWGRKRQFRCRVRGFGTRGGIASKGGPFRRASTRARSFLIEAFRTRVTLSRINAENRAPG